MNDTASQPAAAARAQERAMILTYAAAGRRAGLAALLALDERLAAIWQATRDPMVGQMRLTWWHDALNRLDSVPAPAEPTLRGLAPHIGAPWHGADLAPLVEGWEALLDDAPAAEAEARYAAARGTLLFRLAATLLEDDDVRLDAAGAGWAMADLSHRVGDAAQAERLRGEARSRLGPALAARWPRRLRAVSAMAHLALIDVSHHPQPIGHPSRAARILWHRLTGR